ncbi:MAG TPA: hypothetical protein ENN22_13045 [bacterium]|nr:hypothetical protein [bacterium]
MKKHVLTLLMLSVVGLSLILSASARSQDLKKEGRYYVANIDKKFNVDSGGNLILEKVVGDVVVTTWDQKVVHIAETIKMDVYTEAEAKAVLNDLDTKYRQSGNSVIVGSAGSHRSYMQSNFQIKVPRNFNVDVGTSGGDVSVSELKGNVKIATSGGDIKVVQVDGKLDAKTSGGDISVHKTSQNVVVKTSGGDIELIDILGEVDAKTSGGDIEITNNKARVSAKTSGGTIKLSNIRAEVDAYTSGGDIIVNSSKGRLNVSTSGGDIKLYDIYDTVDARTSGGDVIAKNVNNGIRAKTSGGDIDLKKVNGFIEAATAGGDVVAEMTLTDFSKDHHVSMKSSGGDVKLFIPEKLPATIDATIKLSGFSWRNYDIYSDFPLKIEKDDKERDRRTGNILRASGDINGGGDLIQLSTSNGNIEIKKLK